MLFNLLIALKAGLAAIIEITTTTYSKNSTGPADCYSNFQLNSDGFIYVNSVAASNNYTSQQELWLESGTADQVWVERSNLTGTPGTLNNADPGTGRLNLGTSRDFGVVEVTTTETHTCTFDLDFYDAASGGALLYSRTITLNATEDSP
jgi:hypothetical protein